MLCQTVVYFFETLCINPLNMHMQTSNEYFVFIVVRVHCICFRHVCHIHVCVTCVCSRASTFIYLYASGRPVGFSLLSTCKYWLIDRDGFHVIQLPHSLTKLHTQTAPLREIGTYTASETVLSKSPNCVFDANSY